MNQTFKTRSALLRAADEGLRRERYRHSSQVFAVCAFIIAAFLVAAFLSQVTA